MKYILQGRSSNGWYNLDYGKREMSKSDADKWAQNVSRGMDVPVRACDVTYPNNWGSEKVYSNGVPGYICRAGCFHSDMEGYIH